MTFDNASYSTGIILTNANNPATGHRWDTAWSSDENYHWHECTADGCTVTDNSQKNGYAAHNYNQKVVSDAYKAGDCVSLAIYYYSCECGKAGTETFTYGTALGHAWGDPVWVWTDDYSVATAVFICGNDSSHTEELTANITATTMEATAAEAGQTVYTATVEWNGNSYTDEKTVIIPATGTTTDEPDGGDNSGTEPTDPDASTGDDQTNDNDSSDTGTTTDSDTLTDDDQTGDTTSPQTGDSSNIALWIVLMLTAGAGLTGTILYSHKKNYSR